MRPEPDPDEARARHAGTVLERALRRGTWALTIVLATLTTAWAAPAATSRSSSARSRPMSRWTRSAPSSGAQASERWQQGLAGGDISVIIPAYRAAATIARAVQSVLDQTVTPREILVIDDGSPDDLAAVLAGFGDRVTLVRKPNGGASSARNLGIERASGRLIAFLDADDYWEPDKLARQLEVLDNHPEVGVVGAGLYLEQPGQGQDGRAIDPAIDAALFDRVLRLDGEPAFRAAGMFWTGTIMIRREVLGDQRFDEALATAEDRDLWVRLLMRAPAYLIGDPLATCVLTPGSLSRSSVDRDSKNMLTVIDRYQELLGPDAHAAWQADVYARWSGRLLAQGDPRGALAPAVDRLWRAPSAEALWIVAKSAALAAGGQAPPVVVAPRMRLAVTRVTDVAGFLALEAEWTALHAQGKAGVVVLTWEWLFTWWEEFGAGRELNLLVARDGGRLVGIAPLQRRRIREVGVPLTRIEMLATGEDEADEIFSEYLDFLIEPGREAEVVEAFWHHLTQAGDWDELQLRSVPVDSPSLVALRAAMAPTRVDVEELPRTQAVVVPLAADVATFMSEQSKKMREDLRRHRRMLDKLGKVTLRRATTLDELSAMFPIFVALHQQLWQSRGKPGCFASPRFTRFHERLCGRLFPRGMVHLWLYEVDGRAVAARYSFHVGDRMFEYQSGLDPAFEPRISTGVQIALACMEDAIRSGFREYDLGEGPRPYKLRWNHVLRDNVDVLVSRRTARARTRALLATGELRLRALKREWEARVGVATKLADGGTEEPPDPTS